jgi:protease IV
MAKFFIGLFTGAFLVFLSFFLLFFFLLRFSGAPPEIASDSVLVMRLSGDIPEKPPLELPAFLGGSSGGASIPRVWRSLKKAAVDPRIRAVMVEPSGLSSGWAKLEEIRRDLAQFRKSSGKPVFAYLRSPNGRDYYVALGADRIYLGPQEPLMLKGLRAETLYFKNTLDKLGVTVFVEHAGKYKDFGDMFTRSSMSPETREVLTSVVDGVYGDLVTRIAEARGKSPDEVRAIIDRGPFTAKDALKAGLVDELRFEDQAWGELRNRLKLGAEPGKVSLGAYDRVSPEDAGLKGKSRIGLVIGEGDIVQGDPDDTGDENNITAYGFNHLLREVEKDSTIKGVIVRIDSPGGEVSASDQIWRQMNLLNKKRPMVISMSDVAASGGYYMAMTGAPIVAYPATETGSIGVVFGKPDLRGLYNKIGVEKDFVQRGKHADIDSDYTPLTPDEQALLRQGIDQSYTDFVSKVAAARHRTYGQIEPVAQGRVWLGRQAAGNGLVDELGGLDSAVALLKKQAKIPETETVTIVTYPARRSLWDMVLHRPRPDDLLESRLSPIFGRVPFRAWMKGGYLRILPNWVTVQ